jgi:hypothetical protein
MPNGRSIVLIMDVLGEEGLDRILERARGAASNDRERRQVETLGMMAEYWKKAARFYRLYDQARAATEKGDKQAAEEMGNQLQEHVRAILECLDKAPPGYVSARSKTFWPQELPKP